eukprot:TRINITY_DN7193_c0_g1_i1.p1 TRINITY_DN7193_c0_g1~~TRINITY_DN7193_c0_g1_i1.p1  ORF type:complete len:262 (-),score=17.03 TRINITY_DN7193_c0_g1_i1:188-973(-)
MDLESRVIALYERVSPVTSEDEREHSRDSLESLLKRGNSYSAHSFDREAYRFAQWWNRLDATSAAGYELSNPGVAARRQLYRRYATMQAHARVLDAVQLPVVVRHIVKQDFASLRLLFDSGMTVGGTRYYLTSGLAEWILSFLDYRATDAGPIYCRTNCINFDMLCPVFKHRSLRAGRCEHLALGLQRGTSSSSLSSTQSSSVDSDDESVVSTGSVSAAGARLVKYLRTRSQFSGQSDTQADDIRCQSQSAYDRGHEQQLH